MSTLRAVASRVLHYPWLLSNAPYIVEACWEDGEGYQFVGQYNTREQAEEAARALVEGAVLVAEFTAAPAVLAAVADPPASQGAGQ